MKEKNAGLLKKIFAAGMVLLMIAAAAGCGKASKRTESQAVGVKEVLEQGVVQAEQAVPENVAGDFAEEALPEKPTEPENAEAPGSDAAPENDAEPESDASTGNAAAPETPAQEFDVDLTALSSTMVFSEVYNMVSAPEDYIGKSVKMSGMFNAYRDEVTDRYYYACLILDATACCAQGIEFELEGEKHYPEDYPAKGEMITVAGTFDTYQEGDYTYFTLRNAQLM
ncbi:MAG: hypothetical protein J6I56_08915 [Lachnospiraceae bacterium]|nr:hypothetical protein [Lachnospiraceae bacterium]